MRTISIKRIAVMLLCAIPVAYLALCVLLFVKQRSFLYFPTPLSGFGNSQSVEFIKSEGETLRILTRPADSDRALILFGGNADDVSSYLGSFAFAIPEENLFLVNYRGYSGSTGVPSEKALFADALAVYDHVHERFSNISIVGRSLGTGVAVYLSSMRRVDKLILITPYDSIENIAKNHFPLFPISFLLKDKFDSASRVKDVMAQTLILIADKDQTIPRESTDALVRRFQPEKITVKILSGTTHDSITSGNEFTEIIRQFLKRNPEIN